MRWLRTGAIRTPNGAAAQASVFLGVRQASNGVTGGLTSTASWHRVLAFEFPVPQQRWAKIVTPPGWPWSKPTKHRARNAEVSAESRSFTNTLQDREVLKHAGPMRPGVPRALHYRAPENSGYDAPASQRTGALSFGCLKFWHSLTRSFPRKRESQAAQRVFPWLWFPACAGMSG
jgi:hypothetical protein